MRYYEFDLWIGPQIDDYYPTRARSESMGEAQGKLSRVALDEATLAFQKVSETEADESALKQVGRLLFDALFSGTVGSLYQRALGQVYADDNTGVRIRLRIESPELATLPWELLYDSERDCFLATSRETLLTRYIELGKPVRDLQTALPLRILVIIPGGSGLDVESEKRTILTALQGLGDAVEVRLLEGKVTSSSINREVVLKQFHIFHFIGHGGFRDEKGCLLLNHEQDGESDYVTAKQFSYYFQDYPCMKLVVLNSCSGAASSPHSLTGVAQELVQMGVPAVIAMRREISDDAAKLFAENFYLKLCLGYERGRTDIAVSHARLRMHAELADSDEFANPVLFMRSPQGVIFDLGEGEAITTMRELHTLNAVTGTHDYNIAQLKKEGGEEAASGIAKEAKAQSLVRARVLGFYKKIAVSAAPRVILMAIPLALLLFAASYTRVLNVFRIDDYFGGAQRVWAGTPGKPMSPDVKVIVARQDNNGDLGSPVGNPGWRANNAALVKGLSGVGAKVIVFDLTFNDPAKNVDPGFAEAIRLAQSRGVPVVGAQQIDDNGQLVTSSGLNPTLKSAFGETWGDVEVGGTLILPLLTGNGVYINEYEIASLPSGNPNVGAEMPVVPSLALQAVMQSFAGTGTPPRAYFNERTSEVILQAADSDKIVKKIRVTRQGLSLDMLLDYAPTNALSNNTSEYKDVFKWATSDEEQLKLLFKDSIVLIGYDTETDRHAVIGDGQRSGVFIHANAVSNILKDAYIAPISWELNLVIILAMFTLGVLLQTVVRQRFTTSFPLELPYLGKVKLPVALVVVLVVYLLAAYLAFSYSHVSFDMSYHLAALLFGYWSIAIFRKQLHLS